MDLEEDLAKLSVDANKSQQIFWNRENCSGIVNCPKGNTWNTIGVFSSGKAHIFADEALFLNEFGGFELFNIGPDSNSKVESLKEIMSLVEQDCGFNSYKLFKTLKRHGYIMMRPECKYFPRPRIFETLRGEYSLFKPSSSFKKTNPCGLIGRVLEIKSNDNFSEIIGKLETLEDLAILAISDDFNGFCFLEAAVITPIPTLIETNSFRTKQQRSLKSSNSK